MQNVPLIIIAIITLIFGIAFLGWGIYQIKTGKIVAKHAKNTVDEPRQVGVFFIFISFIGFWATYICTAKFFEIDTIPVVNIIFVAVEMGFLTTAAIYGLVKKRIFGFKNTAKISKNVKKYYVVINLSMLVAMLATLTLFSNMAKTNTILAYVSICIIMLAVAMSAILMTKIEHDSKK